MKILTPHPPGPLLLQEKGVEKGIWGITPRPPPERPSLSGLSTKGRSPFGGRLGVSPPQEWGIKRVERAIFVIMTFISLAPCPKCNKYSTFLASIL